jgi:hypothetical protein
MPKTALAPLDVIDQQISEAWQELLLARMDASRSPNADTLRTEEYAELRVNRLLDRRNTESRKKVDA